MSATPIDVDIPAGVDSGQTIQVPAPAPNAPGGRLRVLLRVEVEPHPMFRVRRGGAAGAAAGALHASAGTRVIARGAARGATAPLPPLLHHPAPAQREGAHIHTPLEMRLGEALLGRTLSVPSIDGVASLTVPPFTQNGDVLRMRGKGVQDPRGRGRGDQLVHVR